MHTFWDPIKTPPGSHNACLEVCVQTLATLRMLLQFLLVHMNFDHVHLEGSGFLCPPLTLAVFLPHPLQCSLSSEGRNLMVTSLLGLSVPSSLPL